MNRLRNQFSTLIALKSAKPRNIKKIIEHGGNELIKVLCDCSYNIIKGNVPLTKIQKKRLQRHKQTLRTLGTGKRISLKKKKLLQKGGFLGVLLKPIVEVLGNLFN